MYNYTAANINVENLELNAGLASEIGSTIFGFDDLCENVYVGVWSISESSGLTVEQMGEIVNGETYINATSSLYADGEMRGQSKLITEESTFVGVGDGVDERLPTNIVLKQNYPNPFNPTTNIEFFIPESGSLVIKSYNILGQKVTTLVDDNFFGEYHTVVFDGSDLASGRDM